MSSSLGKEQDRKLSWLFLQIPKAPLEVLSLGVLFSKWPCAPYLHLCEWTLSLSLLLTSMLTELPCCEKKVVPLASRTLFFIMQLNMAAFTHFLDYRAVLSFTAITTTLNDNDNAGNKKRWQSVHAQGFWKGYHTMDFPNGAAVVRMIQLLYSQWQFSHILAGTQ